MSTKVVPKALLLTLLMFVSVLAGCVGSDGDLNSTDIFDLVDADGDGILDNIDDCPSTAADREVNATGCEKGADDDELPPPTEKAPTIHIGTDGDQTITCDRDKDGVNVPDMVLLSGLIDNYDTSMLDPYPNPSAELDFWHDQIPGYIGNLPGSEYDTPRVGQIVMHTFQLPYGVTGGTITDATLEMRLNYQDDGLPTAVGVTPTDTIMLRFEDTTNAAWSMNIDLTATSPTAPWLDAIYFMHLDTLPLAGTNAAQGAAGNTNLIPSMNSAALLDIVVYDTQMVDYFELSLCVTPGDPPTPTHENITIGKNYECELRTNPDPDLNPLTAYTDYVMTAGINDIFAVPPPSETASPSAALSSQHNSLWPGFTPAIDYDDMNPGAHLLETFDWSAYVQSQASMNNFQSYQLVDASLEFQMRGRSIDTSTDDVFILDHITNPVMTPSTWWANIGTSSMNQVGSWGTHYTMYLSQMPASGGSLDMLNFVNGNNDMIPNMDLSKSLDIKIYDDQAVDYIELHLCFEEVDDFPTPIDEKWQTPGSYGCNTTSNSTHETVYTAGADDDFNTLTADPLTNPSQSLMNWASGMMFNSQSSISPINHLLEFDQGFNYDDGMLIHTFSNLPSSSSQGGMYITDAKLAINFKDVAYITGNPNYVDDMVTIRFENPTQGVSHWTAMVGTLNPSVPEYNAVLHLDELPLSGTTSLEAMAASAAAGVTTGGPVYLISPMNALSILDVTIQDGIIVDDMELTVCSEDVTVGTGGFTDNCSVGTSYVIEEYTAGLQDYYDTQIIDPSMSYSPSQLEFMQWSQSQGTNTWLSSQIGDFDLDAADKWIMHQFTGLPNDILQANLEIGMKDQGNSNTHTDSLILSWFETDDGTASGNWLGGNQNGVVTSDIWNNPSGQYSSQLVNYEFSALTAATTGPGYILNLDMNAMHSAGTTFNGPSSLVAGPYSLIDELNSKSYFEVLIQDDTIVDFIRLTICRDKLADPDSDGDGIPDSVEGDATVDCDGDGTPNYLDIDSDGDNIHDATEWSNVTHASHSDVDGDGTLDYCDTDSDDDGISDSVESCLDIDGDQWGNWRDLDSDADTHLDFDEWTGYSSTMSTADPYDPNSVPI
ncbi:MAG: hypothetical protein DBX05_04870 [Candidatus Poseidoniales archaeon]|nr:MAG: hypothetical protein DBX05_04870 [Candidatus Poseidoniales archaeon]